MNGFEVLMLLSTLVFIFANILYSKTNKDLNDVMDIIEDEGLSKKDKMEFYRDDAEPLALRLDGYKILSTFSFKLLYMSIILDIMNIVLCKVFNANIKERYIFLLFAIFKIMQWVKAINKELAMEAYE
jgi:hypothetical protein